MAGWAGLWPPVLPGAPGTVQHGQQGLEVGGGRPSRWGSSDAAGCAGAGCAGVLFAGGAAVMPLCVPVSWPGLDWLCMSSCSQVGPGGDRGSALLAGSELTCGGCTPLGLAQPAWRGFPWLSPSAGWVHLTLLAGWVHLPLASWVHLCLSVWVHLPLAGWVLSPWLGPGCLPC